jgi:hypothetical protein
MPKTEAIDARGEVRTRVFPCHVAKGKCRSFRECALALALLDEGFSDVKVMRNITYMAKGGKRYRRATPQGFVAMFDHEAVDARRFPKAGVDFTFLPVSKFRRLEYLRSVMFATRRNASASRRLGKKRRPYRPPETLTRNGRGHAGIAA